MKSLVSVLVVVALLSVTGIALCGTTSRPAMVMGTVVKVDGTNLVVSARQGGETTEVTVATTDKTEFFVDAEVGKLADLKAEMRVRVITVAATDTTPAKQIVDATSKDNVMGTVKSVDGKNVVVTVGRGDTAKDVTVVTDDTTTKVFVLAGGRGFTAPKAGTLADVKANMRVTVLPATGTAKKLIVTAATAGRRGGAGAGN